MRKKFYEALIISGLVLGVGSAVVGGGLYVTIHNVARAATVLVVKPMIPTRVIPEAVLPPTVPKMDPNARVQNGFWPYEKHPKPELMWASAHMRG